MIKFTLMIWECSFLGTAPACLPPMEFPKQYDTWYECTRGAHSEALVMISKLGYKYINEHKIAMSYSCRKVEVY